MTEPTVLYNADTKKYHTSEVSLCFDPNGEVPETAFRFENEEHNADFEEAGSSALKTFLTSTDADIGLDFSIGGL